MKTLNLFFGVSLAQYDYTSYENSDYTSDSYSDSYYEGSIDDWKSDRQWLENYNSPFVKKKHDFYKRLKVMETMRVRIQA